ncbi:lysine transporter LysE [Izhakiella australiensis]|uniref:Lysine transporter LysE n=1 Tax=Izhakiella australiensis TaxID=1926881 RepID=A0A1S8YRN7_9GAMM|nr:LysE family translocator [Izhakiella australiensis]OON41476.1 lysine transporter LysE [Izhakiella australiensis]
MPDLSHYLAFALVALGLVLTPGPNMIYLISRSLCQGARAGMLSLCGVALGFVFYMLCAALGISALLMAVPFAYDAIRLAGVGYLLWLAWQTLKPGGRSPFQLRELRPDGPRKLFLMGLFTSLFNPKVAVLYLSLLPQFISPQHGHLFQQFLLLGATQCVISVLVNGCIVFMAGVIARFLLKRPLWMSLQRYLMGTVLIGMAVKVAGDMRR